MKFTCIWLHRDIALESALVMDSALARSSAPTKADPTIKKASPIPWSSHPADRRLTLIRKITGTGDNSVGLPHTVDDSVRGCALIRDFALFYLLYWSLVSNKKKERNSSRGGGKQGIGTRTRYGMWTSLLISPLKKRWLTSVVIIPSPGRTNLFRTESN